MTADQLKKFSAKNKEILFPEKYRKGLKGIALIAVLKVKEEHPDWPLHKVLGEILSTANPNMPPQFLLEFTSHIINHWVAMEEKEKQAVAA